MVQKFRFVFYVRKLREGSSYDDTFCLLLGILPRSLGILASLAFHYAFDQHHLADDPCFSVCGAIQQGATRRFYCIL